MKSVKPKEPARTLYDIVGSFLDGAYVDINNERFFVEYSIGKERHSTVYADLSRTLVVPNGTIVRLGNPRLAFEFHIDEPGGTTVEVVNGSRREEIEDVKRQYDSIIDILAKLGLELAKKDCRCACGFGCGKDYPYPWGTPLPAPIGIGAWPPGTITM